ncbi:hypothetical protein CPC08DRAFT_709475 [Agrocybe pediades]|nr:hypothetical protein CPC08DRAFT_709475 [Agrocybe pediades]
MPTSISWYRLAFALPSLCCNSFGHYTCLPVNRTSEAQQQGTVDTEKVRIFGMPVSLVVEMIERVVALGGGLHQVSDHIASKDAGPSTYRQ